MRSVGATRGKGESERLRGRKEEVEEYGGGVGVGGSDRGYFVSYILY